MDRRHNGDDTHLQGVHDRSNPNTFELESAFDMLGLGKPSPPNTHCSPSSYYWEASGYENSCVDVPHNNDIYLEELYLNRMRSFSASRGNGLPSSSSSTTLVDHPFWSFENMVETRDFLSLDPYDAFYRNFEGRNTGIHRQSSSQSYFERNGDYHPIRPSLVNYDYRVGTISDGPLTGSRVRPRPVNGFESGSGRRTLSLSSLDQVRGDQVRGRVATVAKDHEGCKFLQELLSNRKPEHVEMVYMEVKDHVSELMIDQFGNFLVQKLFDSCNEEQITNILLSLVNKEEIGVLRHVQCKKLVGHVTTHEQRSLLMSALKVATVNLTKDQNGHHVIQQCLTHFPADDTKYVINEIAESCVELAMHKSGCCVLQQAAARAQGEIQDRLVSQIVANALVLAQDPYGNYVLQYLLGLRLPHAKAGIVDRLRGSCIVLSMNKYGSNVVEKCLRECAGEYAADMIIRELMSSLDFLNVLQDQFGNFVAQCALEVAKGDIRYQLVESILSYHSHLHSHPYGKKVLAKARANRHRVLQVRYNNLQSSQREIHMWCF